MSKKDIETELRKLLNDPERPSSAKIAAARREILKKLARKAPDTKKDEDPKKE